MKKLVIFLFISSTVVVVWYRSSQIEPDTYTLYQLTDVSDIRPSASLRYNNLLPKIFSTDGKVITSRIGSHKTTFSECKINSIKDWECKDGNLTFGVLDGRYFSDPWLEGNKVVSKFDYGINWCRWYAQEGIFKFFTRCPFVLLADFDF